MHHPGMHHPGMQHQGTSYETCEMGCFVSYNKQRNMQNCLFRFNAKFRAKSEFDSQNKHQSFKFYEQYFVGEPCRVREIKKGGKKMPSFYYTKDVIFFLLFCLTNPAPVTIPKKEAPTNIQMFFGASIGVG
jgi:nucleoside-diphosphate-sugar epimerase